MRFDPATHNYGIPYAANMLKNPSAQTGDTSNWTDVSNVTVVPGGVDHYDTTPYCFAFAPTASMKQTVPVPGMPPDIEISFRWLPGRDINSEAAVRAQVPIVLHYGDGARGRYLIPAKSFIGWYY